MGLDAVDDPATVAVMTSAVALSIVGASILFAAKSLRYPLRTIGGDVARDGRNAAMVGGLLLLGILAGPIIVVVVVLMGYGRSILRRRAQTRHREHQIRTGLAEVIDLFAVALASGHNLYAATHRVARWSPEPFDQAFTSCISAVDDGCPLSESLEQLPNHLGPSVQPLAAALVAHERYGAPITQNLAGLASESRRIHRHHAEVLARRLPVTLLGPLVVCVLPAFLLLTVVPLVVETLGSVTNSFSP